MPKTSPPASPPPAAPPPPAPEADALRWQLIGDLAVFSAKAGLEALRDLVLIPVALVAGLAGLVLSPKDPAVFFARVLAWGDRWDHFVDLFGSAKQRRRAGLDSLAGHDGAPTDTGPTADDVFDGIGELLVEQHRRGGITAAAKETIDRALDVLQEAVDDLGSARGRASGSRVSSDRSIDSGVNRPAPSPPECPEPGEPR